MKPVNQTTVSIHGVQTEIACHSYADRFLVLVTQVGKVGSLTQAALPQKIPIPPPRPSSPSSASANPTYPPPPPSIELTPLLGQAPSTELQTFHNLLTSQLATVLWSSEESASGGAFGLRKPVVAGIALKRLSDDATLEGIFHGVIDAFGIMVGRST